MPLTRAEQAERTRSRILATSTRLFGERGYDDTSLQLIADEVGLTKAAVYYYYRTKIEILRAIVEPTRRDIDTLLDAAAALPHGAERDHAMCAAYVEFLVTRRSTLTMVNRDPLIKARVDQELQPDQDFDARTIRLLYGRRATVRQRATYYALSGLVDVASRMPELSDAKLRAVLTELTDALLTYGRGD